MAFETELPTDEEVKESESSFLTKPGTYHFAVIDANENPVYRGGDKKGQMMDGFEIEAAVQAGLARSQLRIRQIARREFGNLCEREGGDFRARNILGLGRGRE